MMITSVDGGGLSITTVRNGSVEAVRSSNALFVCSRRSCELLRWRMQSRHTPSLPRKLACHSSSGSGSENGDGKSESESESESFFLLDGEACTLVSTLPAAQRYSPRKLLALLTQELDKQRVQGLSHVRKSLLFWQRQQQPEPAAEDGLPCLGPSAAFEKKAVRQWTATELTLQHAQLSRIARDVLLLVWACSLLGLVRVAEAAVAAFATHPPAYRRLLDAGNSLDFFTIAFLAHGLRQPILGILRVDPVNLPQVANLKAKIWSEMHKFFERQWKLHLAYQYARRGAILMLVARREERLRAVADRAKKLGAMHTRIMTGDVAVEEDCKRFVDETIERFGHLDHLVNNAGISHSFLMEEAADISSCSPVMDITFWGNIYTTFYALPHLRRTQGKIIVNSSVVAWLPIPRMSIYNAAKAGIFNFYETLRIELGPAVGITIVTPGYVESEMTKGKFMTREGRLVMDDEQRDIQVGPWPVEFAEDCAKAIVDGAVRGKRYVQVPAWYSTFFLYRIFAPELLDWLYRFFYVQKSPMHGKPYTKAIVDVTGAKKALYPPSIQ